MTHRRENSPLPVLSSGLFAETALSPFTNVVTVAVGTAIAVWLTPEDVQPAGALRSPAVALAISLLASVLATVWHRPAAVVNPLNVVAASPVYWLLLDPIQGVYTLPNLTPAEVRTTYLAIGLFSASVWVAAFYRSWNVPGFVKHAAKVKLRADALFAVACVAFGLAFLRYAIPSGFNLPLMWEALFQGRFSAPWSRGMLGGWDAFLDHLAYFGYLLPTLAVLIACRSGWLSLRTLVAFGFVIIITALATTGGGRRIIGVMGGSAIAVWLLSHHRPRVKHLLVLGGMAALLLGFLQLMLMYRGVGIGRAFAAGHPAEVRTLQHLHVDDNFLRVCQLTSIMPDQHPHVGMKWLLWVAVRPVPRVFWPGKPVDPGFNLPDYLGMKGVSLSTSLIGELYMAFGLLGCSVAGWVMGRLAVCLRDVLPYPATGGSLLTFGLGLLALFAGMRSGIDLVLMSYSVLAWVGLAWFIRNPANILLLPRRRKPVPATQVPPMVPK